MKSREAIKRLKAVGYEIVRQGRGSHIILQKGKHRIVISHGEELSCGMTKKVQCYERK